MHTRIKRKRYSHISARPELIYGIRSKDKQANLLICTQHPNRVDVATQTIASAMSMQLTLQLRYLSVLRLRLRMILFLLAQFRLYRYGCKQLSPD
jgi:hypothetical protein